jgi:hypothetical protein
MKIMRPGDWLMIAVAGAAVVAMAAAQWGRSAPTRAQVRLDGRIVAELPLSGTHRVAIEGALARLGETVVEVEPGRARIATDPGPRQYCVQQGWLTRAGSVAVCAPSRISLQLAGPDGTDDSVVF